VGRKILSTMSKGKAQFGRLKHLRGGLETGGKGLQTEERGGLRERRLAYSKFKLARLVRERGVNPPRTGFP